MEITNIKAGLCVKNYKALCCLLNEPVKNGNAKKAQLKEWERYFSFHKKDNDKYILVIDEVYDTPLPEAIRVDDVYSALVQVILCNYLRMPEKLINGSLIVTKKRLYEICGMVNHNYIDVPTKTALLYDFEKSNGLSHKSGKWTVNEFNMRVNSRLNNILYKVLNRLKKKKYIIYDDYYEITEIINGIPISREASGYERNAYLNACQNVKNNLGITYINDYNSGAFYNAVREYIKEEYGWDSCYEYIRINYADKFTQQYCDISRQELQMEIDKNRAIINEHIVEMFERLIREDYKKNRTKIHELKKASAPKLAVGSIKDSSLETVVSDKEINEKYEVKTYNDNYIQLQQQLVDIFIKLIISEEMHDIERNL